MVPILLKWRLQHSSKFSLFCNLSLINGTENAFCLQTVMFNSITVALAIGHRAFTCRHMELTEMLCLSDHQTVASRCAINNAGLKQHLLSFVICKTDG